MRKTVLVLAAAALALLLASSVALAAFPGGNGKIAFVRWDGQDDEIFTAYPDGSDEVQLTDNSADESQPAFSANGNKIVFESNRTGTYLVYTMNADGSNVRQLTDTKSWDPAFSPDGRKIVYVREVGEGSDLYVKKANGTGTKRLTRTEVAEGDPDWGPGGRRIAFVRYSYGQSSHGAIHTITPDGKRVVKLAQAGRDHYFRHPDFSPDGKRIVLIVDEVYPEDYLSIHTMNASTGAYLKRIAYTGDDYDWLYTPAFSPDGKKVVFVVLDYDSDSGSGLYVKNSNGKGEARRLLSTYAEDPDWQPLP